MKDTENSKPKSKSMITVRISRETHADLLLMAKERGTSLNQHCVHQLVESLKSWKEEQKCVNGPGG